MPFFKFPIGEADAFQTAALPYTGDVNAAGGGVTTSGATNPNVLAAYGLSAENGVEAGDSYVDSNGAIRSVADNSQVGRMVTRNMAGNDIAEHPFWTLGTAIVALAIIKFWVEKGEDKGDIARITVGNAFRIYLLWLVPDLIVKWFFHYFYFASYSATIQYS